MPLQDLCEKHRFYRRSDRIVGSGAEGYIYQVCSAKQVKQQSSHCTYVVKELPLYSSTAIDETAARFGIGPGIMVEHCPSKNKTYLIQERFHGTLTDLYEKNKGVLSAHDKKHLNQMLFDSMDKLKIFHNDLHGENIMYKNEPQDQTTSKRGHRRYRFYLIDYSTSVPMADMGYKRFDSLLTRHQYIEIDKEMIPILTEDQMDQLSKKYRPVEKYSQTELQIQRRNQQVRKKAKQEAERATMQRIRLLTQKKTT